MSTGSDTDTAVHVESDGLSVEKRFTADEFPVPAVRFTLRSERDAPTEFRLVDHIPEGVPMDHIGFHPDYDNDGWTAYQDRRVEYRRRLDPGEEVTTVYGIRTDDPDAGAEFLGEPTVEEVDDDADPAGGVAEVIGGDSSQVVREVLSGDREAVPGGERPDDGRGAGLDLSAAEADLDPDASPDAAEGDGADDAVDADPPADGTDPDPADDADGSTASDDGAAADDGDDVRPSDEDGDDVADADGGGAADADGGDAADAEGVAAALAAELRAGGVDPADRETLRRELESHGGASVDARISRLQSNVEDLAAYTDALEEFLDDNGTAEEIVEGLHGEVDALRESLSAVEADVAAADDEREELESGLDDVRREVEEVGDALSAATADVADVRDDLDSLAADVEGEDDAVDEVRDDVAALREEVGSLSARVDDEADDLREELAGIRAEMREFEAFRDRLSSAFGADGRTNGGSDAADADGTTDDE